MKLYKTTSGIIVEHEAAYFSVEMEFDALINRDGLYAYLASALPTFTKLNSNALEDAQGILAPIGKQEVWAAGVTYLRSRDARMEESKDSGGATFYDKVYVAERPELFFKSLAHRVAGNDEEVYIRRDSKWDVPEPELTLYINSNGNIEAYTIGNDMSSRSIEGENPLYLPQAKTYERSAALGPCLYISESPISPDTNIHMEIKRNNTVVFEGTIQLNQMKRTLPELAGFLFREMEFPFGSFLMTGTCLVPGNDFTLQENDMVSISIDKIGTLTNRVIYRPV
jgi:2-dehydro-3-deoxy-D-arabinonate dehydratase